MRVAIAIALALPLLAACAGQRAENAYNEANASCLTHYAAGTAGYNTCMQYKAMEFQAAEDNRRARAAALQTLGLSLQNMGAAPAQPVRSTSMTQCHQVGIYWQCNSF